MVRVLKWASIGIGGILLLGVAAALILPSVVNLERYRILLASRVGKALGREVRLGDLRVSLWGGIGAEVKGIQVAQAPGFGAEPLLSADGLRVRLQLLPLFRGHLKVSTALLERPRIHVTHARDGRWSVDDLLKAPPAPPPAKPSGEVGRPGKAPLLGGLLISEVAVRGGEITLFDETRSKPITLGLADLDLLLRQASPSSSIEIQSRAMLAGSGAGRIEASGRISSGEPDGPVVEATVDLRDVETAPWQGLLGDGGTALSGPLAAEIKLSGPLAKVAFSGTLDLKAVAVQVGGVLRKAAGDEASVRLQGRREEPGLMLSKLLVTLKEVTVNGSLRIPDLRNPQVSFDATSATVDLDRLLAPPKAKAAWLGPAAAAAAPLLRASPSASGGSGPAAKMSGKAPEPGLTAQGRIKIGDLRYQGLLWSAVTADLRYRGGRLELPVLQADFMNGRLTATGEVDLRPKAPRVALTTRLTDVATEPLVKALARGSWSLKGVLNGEGSLSFTGFSPPAILGSASGSGSVRLTDGRLTDYKPLDRLGEVIGPILAGQGTPVRLNEFEQLAGHYTLDNGVLRTKDLTLTKAEGTVTAVGALGLVDSSLDFDVVAKLGRTTVEAKVTGTTSKPIVVPKLGKFQRRIETEMEKILPGEQGKGLKELFKGLFGK